MKTKSKFSRQAAGFQIFPRTTRRGASAPLLPWSGSRDRFRPESLPLAAWFDPAEGVYRDGAARFSGSGQYLSRADESAIRTGDIPYTFGGWFRLDTLAQRHMLFTKGDEYYLEYSLSYGLFRFVVDSTHQTLAASAGSPAAGQWHFVVCWHDPDANLICIQVNNGAVDSAAYAGGSPVYTDPLNLGAYGGGLQTQGRADSAFFMKRLLTGPERAALFNAGAGAGYGDLTASFKTDLISWWDLDQASGARLDSHGGRHLTDNGGVALDAGIVSGKAQPGDPVGLWASRAGEGLRATQGVFSKRPLLLTDINGTPYLFFDGVDDLLEINGCAAHFSGEATLTAAFTPQSGNYSLYHASSSGGWWAHGTAAEFGDFRGASLAGYPAGAPLTGGSHVVSISSTGSVYEVRVDGESAGAGAGNFSVLDKHSIGGSWESGDRQFIGRAHGFFLCRQALAPRQLQQAERWLANKNGANTL